MAIITGVSRAPPRSFPSDEPEINAIAEKLFQMGWDGFNSLEGYQVSFKKADFGAIQLAVQGLRVTHLAPSDVNDDQHASKIIKLEQIKKELDRILRVLLEKQNEKLFEQLVESLTKKALKGID